MNNISRHSNQLVFGITSQGNTTPHICTPCPSPPNIFPLGEAKNPTPNPWGEQEQTIMCGDKGLPEMSWKWWAPSEKGYDASSILPQVCHCHSGDNVPLL